MLRLRFSTLLLFLLPALIVLGIVVTLSVFAMNEYVQQKERNQKIVEQTVEDLQKTIGFIESVGQQYSRLNNLLIATNKGQLSHAEAYLIHSKMVDKLSVTESQLINVKKQLTLLNELDIPLDTWQKTFNNFKNFSLMASDMVAIDPRTSKNYIDAAQAEYFKFVDESNTLSKLLTKYTNETYELSNQKLEESLNSIYLLGISGLIFALIVAIISASKLSSYLQIILVSLRELAAFKQEVPKLDAIKKMVKHTRGELKHLGTAVLKFKQTLELNKQEEARIFKLAFFDDLTQLPNMQSLKKDLQQHLTNAQNHQLNGILIKLNINRFKVFNNALGYDFGDRILVEVTERLKNFASENSQLYRGSSDEFFILIDPLEIEEDALQSLLQETITQIKNLFSSPFEIDNESLMLSCNQGLIAFPTDLQNSPTEIIRDAMIALHNSKELGSNQAVIFESQLSKQITDSFELQKDLEKAISDNSLEFYLQSQIHSKESLPRAEALIRWNHPQRGWIRPDIFIKLAEQSHLIIEIDKWMLSQVCQFIAEQKTLGKELHISVNISGHHFSHPNFIEHIQTIFAQTKVDPTLLTLELTENVFLNDFGAVVSKMQHLKAFGVRFSIDDFGTGYSSLSYLKRLPMDEIKIDRAFIKNITHDKEDQTLVKAVFEMAKTFNLEVVAEGVETAAQEATLKSLGNPIIQGFLYAKPIEHSQWLAELDT